MSLGFRNGDAQNAGKANHRNTGFVDKRSGYQITGHELSKLMAAMKSSLVRGEKNNLHFIYLHIKDGQGSKIAVNSSTSDKEKLACLAYSKTPA